jgi:phosphatidylserine/phosphatidylglycerophosphate/cardiolipin synthase-like enzyme
MKVLSKCSIFFLLLWLVVTFGGSQGGCDGQADAEQSPDGKYAPAAPGGKADSIYSDCELRQVVAWVNDPALAAADLKAAGIHSRAADNIVVYRDGADGMPQTEDDNYFDSSEELDDVYFVGPVAFSQMVSAVEHRCAFVVSSETIFSPQSYEDSHLARVAELIAEAQTSIDVAMYSFRDYTILEALENAVARGVDVRFIFNSAYDDRSAPEGTMSAALEEIGINVRYVNKIMHHKFAIIDGPRSAIDDAYTGTLISGSGNWSYSAGTRYDENTVVLRGAGEVVLSFQRDFNLLWENSRDFVWVEGLAWEPSKTITAEMIPDGPAADTVFTSANFKTSVTSYGPTFSVVSGRNAVSDRIVALIEGAESSIWIASGHLRSRPVAEALLAKHAENPELDIRVYLDGQEYISEWYADHQDRELAECLAEAGDSVSQQQKCLDKGYYFSHPLFEAGIALRFKYYAYRWHYTYAEQMHHKYLIVDGQTVISGSYNLSDNAEHNTMENVIIYDRSAFPTLIDAFVLNFETIWSTQRNSNAYEDLLSLIRNTDEPIPIVFDAMALTWPEVTELKNLIYDFCPDINSKPFREEPESHTVCYR